MMETGGSIGALELRAARDGSRRLTGRFPYNKRAVLSDGGKTGRPQKEVFAPKAFAYRIEKPDEEIHLLIGHDYDRPLASRSAGTFFVSDSPEAVTFEAVILPELQKASYVQDFFAGFAAGLVLGISPGFRIPPKRVEPNAEVTTEEDPADGMALIRTIFSALLFEFSMVTVPAYKDTTVEERSGMILSESDGLHRTLNRWRA
jgi:HK97 family phage prohead protease